MATIGKKKPMVQAFIQDACGLDLLHFPKMLAAATSHASKGGAPADHAAVVLSRNVEM